MARDIILTLESGREVIVTWDSATSHYVEGLTICRLMPDGTSGPDITERVIDPSPDYEHVMQAIDDYYRDDEDYDHDR